MGNGYQPESTRWYNKTWLVLLLCLFVFPLGLVGLWKSRTIPPLLKAVVVGMLAYVLYQVAIVGY